MSAIDMISAEREMPLVASVRAGKDLTVQVKWAAGGRVGKDETIDLSPLIGQFKLYAPLRDDASLFATIKLSEDGGAVEWAHGEIDMSAQSLQRLASEQMSAEDFKAFLRRNRLTRNAAAAALGRSLRMIQNYVEGQPIPRVVALACKGYESDRLQRTA